ncbi:LacI family DNA-binding transcriptional regulator [Hephaestia sp. GCM10023244]|uniref:LacI family DNA-binding transcriptional regulator n=1 Tax=unclassified Hephaestia TaxID=2631281 RepID=UPI0020776766|nr:LacI family DNA-binding transcriptional regulator [Hephaestia sp. MAHUQ-44]MCM8731010.1 LacI family DNA-binding transcriptional regulator [Hephaestia sp. MAHUQ-44]
MDIAPKRKPTIDDVAALSRVARVTVSRVINGEPGVRAATRQRVLDAIAQLGYKVNVQARNLAAGNSRQIMLVHESDVDAEPNSYYFSGLELGALTGCARHGYQLAVQAIDPHKDGGRRQIQEQIDSGRCDGLILTPPFSDRYDLVEALIELHCPVICIAAGAAVRAIAASIGIDDERAGYDMARHLLALGHRRIGYIHGIEGHESAEGRYAGFARALREMGISPDPESVARGNFTFRSGIDGAEHILAGSGVTAIMCANDDMAAGALLTCHKRGLAIPGDVSVVGFDDTPVSDIVWPPLTTVHQPIKEVGRQAAIALIKHIEVGAGAAGYRYDFIAHRIVERQSAGPPSRQG